MTRLGSKSNPNSRILSRHVSCRRKFEEYQNRSIYQVLGKIIKVTESLIKLKE